MTDLTELNTVVVEADSAGRTIMRQLLRQLGLSQVRLLKNAATLLRQYEQLDIDLLVLDYDLGEQLRGPDLVRFLQRRQRLPVCCRVVFITAEPAAVLADLPYLPLPCRVLAKPVSLKLLSELLRETAVLQTQARQLLRAMQQQAEPALLRQLIRIRAGQLPQASRDTIRQMQVHLLLNWRYPQEAWALAARIRDPLRALELKLELAYLLGNHEAMQQQLQLMTQTQQLRRKQAWYDYRMQALQLEQLPADLLAGLRESELTPHEVALQAIVLYQDQGWLAARSYLENRLGLSRDYCQRNIIALMLLTLTLLDACATPDSSTHLQLAAQYVADINPDVGLLDFRRFSGLMPQALQALAGPAEPLQAICQQLQEQQSELDAFQCLFAVFICLRAGRVMQATGLLWSVDTMLARMPLAAERLVVGFFHRRLFDLCQPDPVLAAETYTQWGLAHHDAGHWYRALKMFWQAQRLSPQQPDYQLNLLTQLRQLTLEQYWDQSCEQLIEHLQQSALTPGQQQQLRCLLTPPAPRRAKPERTGADSAGRTQ